MYSHPQLTGTRREQTRGSCLWWLGCRPWASTPSTSSPASPWFLPLRYGAILVPTHKLRGLYFKTNEAGLSGDDPGSRGYLWSSHREPADRLRRVGSEGAGSTHFCRDVWRQRQLLAPEEQRKPDARSPRRPSSRRCPKSPASLKRQEGPSPWCFLRLENLVQNPAEKTEAAAFLYINELMRRTWG